MTITTHVINNLEYMAYVDIVEADAYFSLNAEHGWNDLSELVKKVNLVNATRRIDLLRYKSEKESASQALKFPRKEFGLPEDIELATILLANIIVMDPTQQFVTGFNAKVKRVKAGPVDIEFYQTIDVELAQAENSIIDPTIRALLSPYIATSLPIADGAVSSVGAAYGTGGKSAFDSLDRYHRFDSNY